MIAFLPAYHEARLRILLLQFAVIDDYSHAPCSITLLISERIMKSLCLFSEDKRNLYTTLCGIHLIACSSRYFRCARNYYIYSPELLMLYRIS